MGCLFYYNNTPKFIIQKMFCNLYYCRILFLHLRVSIMFNYSVRVLHGVTINLNYGRVNMDYLFFSRCPLLSKVDHQCRPVLHFTSITQVGKNACCYCECMTIAIVTTTSICVFASKHEFGACLRLYSLSHVFKHDYNSSKR